MKKSIFTALKISMVMLGSLIGAGFATGKEVVTFFGIYGKFYPHLIVVAGVLFFVALRCFFMAGKHTENRAISYFFNMFIFVAEFILLSAMISALFCECNIFLSSDILAYILILFCFAITMFGVSGLTIANVILTPILIVSIIIVTTISIKTNYNPLITFPSASTYKLLSYPFLYFGLNLFTSFPLCKELGKDMTKREIYLSSIFTSVIITATILLIATSIIHSSPLIASSDMPLAILAFNISPVVGYIFFFVILMGIITTLLSCLYILASYHKKFKIKRLYFCIILLLFAYLFNFIGFSSIITLFYPLIGIFGVALYLCIETNNKLPSRLPLML